MGSADGLYVGKCGRNDSRSSLSSPRGWSSAPQTLSMVHLPLDTEGPSCFPLFPGCLSGGLAKSPRISKGTEAKASS
eukprot:scaffold636_cov252-Pinguiococcus_pyrenoidosus.AAC.6